MAETLYIAAFDILKALSRIFPESALNGEAGG